MKEGGEDAMRWKREERFCSVKILFLQTHYVSSAGDAELLEALSNDYKKNFGVDFSPKQFVVAPGT